MSESPNGRFDAPIRYVDVRTGYNTMRAIGGLAIAIGAAVAWSLELSPAPWVMLAGLVVVVDGLYRRWRGASAFPLLLVDVLAMGGALLARGHTPSIEAAGVAYIITASLLLLDLRRAFLLIAIGGLTAVPIAFWSPLADGNLPTGSGAVLTEIMTVGVFVAVIAQLLISTGRALHSAGETQREALETERRAGELKNEFVSMVSHELRTPLTSIAGFADTLRESWPRLDDTEIEEFLTILRREAGHLSNLVEDILVIPRLEAGHLRLEPQELDLRSEAFATAQVVFQDGSKEFSVSIPGGVVVAADPVRLKQVLRNLLENARKYGGDQVLVEGEPAGDHYKVMVSDNGPGVPESHRDRIFEHFEQLTKGDSRSDSGVGLGLPIAKTLVEAMGGRLWYESRFPTGARFNFTVRLARIAPAEDDPVAGSEPSRVA